MKSFLLILVFCWSALAKASTSVDMNAILEEAKFYAAKEWLTLPFIPEEEQNKYKIVIGIVRTLSFTSEDISAGFKQVVHKGIKYRVMLESTGFSIYRWSLPLRDMSRGTLLGGADRDMYLFVNVEEDGNYVAYGSNIAIESLPSGDWHRIWFLKLKRQMVAYKDFERYVDDADFPCITIFGRSRTTVAGKYYLGSWKRLVE